MLVQKITYLDNITHLLAISYGLVFRCDFML